MTGTPGAGTAPTPLSTFRQQVSTELANERRRADLAEARGRAREVLSAQLADQPVTPAQAHRITESVMRELPQCLVEQDGRHQLDEARLTTRLNEHVDQALLEVSEALSAAGYGQPRDVGPSLLEESGGYQGSAETQIQNRKARFMRLGLTEAAAERAAKGR